ncbi:unnamed protein product [Clavelina lepadiformis]|uniref:Peptidase S1 domain-containing protein n=1 Tax=Clavelina lepadiformis TaxID=159417 RepID=A0ABP0FLK0_CLALP
MRIVISMFVVFIVVGSTASHKNVNLKTNQIWTKIRNVGLIPFKKKQFLQIFPPVHRIQGRKLFSLRRKRSSEMSPQHTYTLLGWQDWTPCDVSDCGQVGRQYRTRTCLLNGEVAADQTACGEALMQVRKCEVSCEQPFEVDVTLSSNASEGWLEWSSWSECDVTCGSGMTYRRRHCNSSMSCRGPSDDQKRCLEDLMCPAWLNWEPWSSCSLTCGTGGVRLRKRKCARISSNHFNLSATDDILKQSLILNVEVPLTVLNNSHCHDGEEGSEEAEPCLEQLTCQSHWLPWTTWSSCSVSCGMGFSSTWRKCSGERFGGLCNGSSTKYRRCFAPPCWSHWSDYTKCSKTCGNTGGYMTRTRICTRTSDFLPQYLTCNGSSVERAACSAQECPEWAPWSRYTRCSLSCNGGTKTRSRRCLRGNCRGRSIDIISCNYQPCPYWSQWSSFSCCSVTCGNDGIKERTRVCRHSYGKSNSCDGKSSERRPCAMRPCNTSLPSVLDSFECGVRNNWNMERSGRPILRIFGGKTSRDQGWPWQASWQHRACHYCDWIHFCGATLIAPQWIITASHCTEESAYRVKHDDPGDTWSVVLGMRRLYQDGERFFVRRVFIHPDYEYDAVTRADIALMKLRRPVALTPEVRPVCLPHLMKPIPGETCFITGWGYTASPLSPNAQLSVDLLEAGIPIQRFEDCQRLSSYYSNFLDKKNHMCAGDPVIAASDSCTGDSGGPLVCSINNDEWYLGGVTSFGFTECGTKGHVGIYTPIINFEGWIRSTLDSYSHDSC